MRPLQLPSQSVRREKGGFVLVIVLLLVALCTVLVVGFLIVVSNDYATSKTYSSEQQGHQLADSTVQLVIGQIQQATTSTANVGWASQPGMIRTYDNSGTPQTNYKLYSSGIMTTSGALTVAAAPSTSGNTVNDFDPAWYNNTALWTDLNSPVTDDTGTLNYPIIDGNNLTASSGVSTYQSTNGQSVQGFSINSPPISTQGSLINPVPMPVQWLYQLKDGTIVAGTANGTNTVTVTSATAINPIVARIAFWTDDETSKINLNTACGDQWSIPQITSSVPGQPGFGTSSLYTPPGAFWDIPRCYTSYEYFNLALNQPSQNEFQRYPGHPATVYLSAVFPNLTRDQLFSIVPRINNTSGSGSTAAVGSEGGTTLASQAINPDSDRLYGSVDELLFAPTKPSNLRTLNDTSTSIIDKANLQQAKFFLTANSRAPEVNIFDQPRIAMWPIDSDVISKETTGALSPRGTAFDSLMAFCSHLGTLGSGNDYCIQRQAGGYMSQTADLSIQRNVSLYSYLTGLMGANLPGFGGNLATKFKGDTNQIATEIFDYIRCTNPSDDNIAFKTVDGSGNPTNDANCYTPGSTYTTETLTGGYNSGNFFVPKNYHAFIAPGQIGSTQGFGRSVTISEMGLSFICCGDGGTAANKNVPGDGGVSVNYTPSLPAPPITYYSNFPPLTGITSTTPPTVAQIDANAFFNPAPPATPPPGYATPQSPGFNPANWNYNLPTYNWVSDTGGTKWTGLQLGQRRVKAVFLLNPYTVSPGYSTMHLDLGMEVVGLGNLNLQGYLTGTGNPTPGISTIPMEFTQDGTVVLSNLTLRTPTWGLSTEFFVNAFYAPLLSLPENPTIPSPQVGDSPVNFVGQSTPGSGTPYRLYPFVSAPITVDANSPLVLSGGNNVTVKLWHLSQADESSLSIAATTSQPTSTSTLIQTINANLSQLGNFQAPSLCTNPGVYNPVGGLYYAGSNGIIPPILWDFTQSGVFGSSNAIRGRFFDCQNQGGHSADFIYNSNDSVRSLVPGYPTDTTGVAGDYRMLAALNVVPIKVFVPHRLITDSPTSQNCYSFSALAPNARAFQAWGASQDTGPSPQPSYCTFGCLVTSIPPQGKLSGNVQNMIPAQTGDFDNGSGSDMDGPYINKPDTGFSFNTQMGGIYPYFSRYADNSITTFYSPNRQVSSPGKFGSLPVGVQRGIPWTTLLFRPQPTHPDGVPVPDAGAAPSTGGPYGALVADHMLMDFFWMPVVEPYAISEPFSTAGKINMNYQIAPFTYISRETAIDALLKSQRVLAIPNTALSPTVYNNNQQYKNPWGYPAGGNGGWPSPDYRSDLNLSDTTGTLRQFQEKFASGDLFRSASQICDIYLTPSGQSWSSNSSATQFWAANQLTGDNAREAPYANLYGCLTTKSNTYTVHFRVQTLQKIASTPVNQWVDGSDVVTCDYRGSSLIERYVDPSNPNLPDFSQFPADAAHTLGPYYKFRILSTRKFAP